MLEPISMAMTAGAVIHTVYQLTKSIYTFTSGTATVDQSVQSMIKELDSLRESTYTIETCLRNPLLHKQLETAEKSHRDDLFLSIDGSLKNTQNTLDNFQQTLDSIREPTSLGPLRQPLILLGLNFNAKEIMIYRAQITAHVHALSMGMHSITVYASIQSPHVVINEVVPKLNVLIELVADLSSEQLDRANLSIPEAERARIEETTTKLKVASQQVISHARSVTSRGSTTGSTVSGSRLLSVRGGISDWNSIAAREVRESTLPEGFDGDPDSEEETGVELFESILKEGHRRHQGGHIEDATSCYRKALEEADKTRLRIQPNKHYNDACLKLAEIHQQRKEFDEAKVVLTELLAKYDSVPPGLADQIVDAWYSLAQVLTELKELDQAEEYCTKVMHAQRRRDKASDAYRNSVLLLASINDEKGDTLKAIGYRGLVSQPTSPLSPSSAENDHILSHDHRISQTATVVSNTSASVPQDYVGPEYQRSSQPASPLGASAPQDYLDAQSHRATMSVSIASTSTAVEGKICDIDANPLQRLERPTGQDLKNTFGHRDNPLTTRYGEGGKRHGAFEWTVPFSIDGATLPQILEANADHLIYKSLEALNADLFTRPLTSIKSRRFDPHIALRHRIHEGHLEVAWLLLYKLDRVKTEWEKRTRHFWSSRRPDFPQRIDANYKSEHGLTFLEDACISKISGRAKHDMIDLLLHYGVNVNPRVGYFVPLARATLDGDHDLVEILLAHKADPDVRLRNPDGTTERSFQRRIFTNDTVLITATEAKLSKVVDALLFHKAKVDIPSSKGTALCVAAEKGCLDIVKTLLDYGANVNAIRPVQNMTPLCLASKIGHTAVVRALLNAGADVKHEVKPNFTAIVYAIEQRHHAIADMLRDKGAKE